MARLSALLATGRVANLPTVWTHVLTGVWLVTHGYALTSSVLLWPIVLMLLAASLLYVGGCFLGDAWDAAFDRANRPDRPIPRGILSSRAVAAIAWLMLVAAWLLAPLSIPAIWLGSDLFADLSNPGIASALFGNALLFATLATTLLLACIVSYAALHKRVPWLGMLLMGGCRGLLILWAATLASLHPGSTADQLAIVALNPAVLAAAAASALYTVGFVLVARTESNPDQPVPALLVRLILLAAPLGGLAIAGANLPVIARWPVAAATALFLAWLWFAFRALPTSKPLFVGRCLAGFCLFDTLFLSFGGLPPALLALAGFLLAVLLQKLTPAT
jgi:4-hydroxybenzoate polyprenyltransferase